MANNRHCEVRSAAAIQGLPHSPGRPWLAVPQGRLAMTGDVGGQNLWRLT